MKNLGSSLNDMHATERLEMSSASLGDGLARAHAEAEEEGLN
jgi:hypothetical protein